MSTEREVAIIKSLLDRPIAFHRPFVRLTGSVAAALFLSQAFYWAGRTTDGDGWFYKTRSDWEAETGLSRFEQEAARKKLVALGILDEQRRGVPCQLYFRVNLEILADLLAVSQPASRLETSQLVGGKRADSNKEPESTSETTHREDQAPNNGGGEVMRSIQRQRAVCAHQRSGAAEALEKLWATIRAGGGK